MQASSTAHTNSYLMVMAWRAGLVDADDADDVVVEQIRTEMQGRGRPLGDWQAFPSSP
jgi:hypothetical protein